MLETLTAELETDPNTINWNEFNLLNCQRCGLCRSRQNVVTPRVAMGSKILFIGDFPDQEEDRFGEPFVGQQVFNRLLAEVGISREQASFAHVVNCRTPLNRDPEAAEINACTPILEHTIQRVNPQVIVPLGNIALKRIMGFKGITKHNGHVLESEKYPGVKVVPVTASAFALRDPKNEAATRFGLQRVKSLIDGTLKQKISEVTYVDTIDKFNLMMEDLESKSVFAVDIETSSLNWVDGYIVCVAFSSTKGKSYVLPWILGDNNFYDFCRKNIIGVTNRDFIRDIGVFCKDFGLQHPRQFWSDSKVFTRLKALLENENISKILHNYAFDYKFLEHAGLTIKGTIYDTMILHHLLDETRGTHNLKDCALVFTEYGQYEDGLKSSIKITDKQTDSYALIPMEILVPYAGTDADATLQLYELFIPRIEQEGFSAIYHGYLVPQTKMLMAAEKEGIKIDQEYRNNAEIILTKEIERLDVLLNDHTKDYIYEIDKLTQFKKDLEILEATPVSEELSEKRKARKIISLKRKIVEIKPGINYDSPVQLAAFLFNHLNLPVVKLTDKQNRSTDEEVLEVLAKQSEFAKFLLTRRKLSKVLNTYIMGMKEVMWKDGKVHSNFLTTGTETGRLASKNPNMQNLSRNPEKGDPLYELKLKVRDLFIIDEPDDYILVETDYSQAELRLAAEYSRDENLYNAFLQGRDPHAELAVRIYHRDRIPDMLAGVRAETIVTKEERQKAKTANF